MADVTQAKNEDVKQIEVNEQIMLFTDFIEHQYKPQLFENVLAGKEFLTVDFQELSKFNPDLAQLLLINPEEVIKAGELSIRNFDLPKEVKNFKIRLANLPSEQRILIRDIRSHQLGRFIWTEGIVRQKSDVRPQVTTAKFECPSCGNVIPVLQLENKFREPTRCGCGRKGKFRLLSKELVDAQGIVLEEATKDLEGGAQPKRINLFLQQDLVSPMSDKRTNPGTSVRITGIIKEVPVMLRSGGQSTKFDLLIEVNHIEPVEEDYSSIQIDAKEEQEILELAKDSAICEKLAMSLAPGIYGHDKIKEALILQFAGGYSKITDDGVKKRGDIHVLLIGDPGAGKSQLLKRASVVAPKARYVSGKGVSGAGLTAAVVRDEFLGGWSLEAGALVLANKGVLMIDEMDKMSPEDRSAMHEGLEQQSFHYDTLFQFSDGSEMKIGDYVESLFERNSHNIIKRKECFILKLDCFDKKMLTTDWNSIYETSINRVSKHIAPREFIEIISGNGRSLLVTPEHPIYCMQGGKIITKPACQATPHDWIPVPLHIPIQGEIQQFNVTSPEIYNSRAQQHIKIPIHNDKDFFKIIGYILSEGSQEINRGKPIGINFTNNELYLINDFIGAMERFFGLKPYLQQTKKEGESWFMARYVSTELISFLEKKVPEILVKSSFKKIPQLCMKGSLEDISALLSALFEGDGHASKKLRTIRIGFASTSKRMAEQVQDLLLRFKIRSNITLHNSCYKVSITGYENLYRFSSHIGFVSERKNNIVHEYLKHADQNIIRTIKDIIPTVGKEMISLFNTYKIKTVGNNALATMRYDYIIRNKNISRKHLQKAVLLLEEKLRVRDAQRVAYLRQLAFSDISFEKIKSVRRIPNIDQKWTYDITIEPHHTFISQNMILHNTISISKANIQATLRCDTTVLAAANPKFGRFDPYETINKQIDMPPALINRFDLIFVIKDLPDEEQDKKIAKFILTMHKDHQTQQVPINTELLRKYLIYARQKIYPHFSQEAIDVLQDYYVKMRSSGSSDDGSIKAIPISARQLDALVRLSEASAKIRLSQTVTIEDAQRAIFLLQYCLQQVGIDPETGKLDIDRISIGITSSQRNKIAQVRDIINELEEALGKIIPLDELIKHAAEKGLAENVVEEALEKLKRSGDIFSPKPNHIQKI